MRENRISFTIPIMPMGQARAKARAMNIGDRSVAQIYKTKNMRIEEEKFIAFLMQNRPSDLISRQVWLGFKAYFPIPESKPLKWKQAALSGIIRPDKKPDLSNITKFLEDCMNKIFWDDDKRVVGYLEGTGKYYSDRPRWEITIEW